MIARRAGLARLLAAAVLAGTVLACVQPLESAAGIVVAVDSPSLGRVDTFELRTVDGEILAFDTTDLAFRRDFPAAHLSDHMRLAEAVRVTYRRDGERLVAVRLDDEG